MMSGALPLLLVITPVSLLLEELTCVLLSWWLVDVMMLPGVLLVKVEVRLSKNIGGQYCLKQTMKNEETNCTREMYALKIHLPYNKHNTVASGTSPVHAEQGEFFLPPPNLLVWAFTGTLGNTTMTTIRTSQHSVQMETCNEQCPSRVHTGIGTTGISTTCVLMTTITAPSRVVQVNTAEGGDTIQRDVNGLWTELFSKAKCSVLLLITEILGTQSRYTQGTDWEQLCREGLEVLSDEKQCAPAVQKSQSCWTASKGGQQVKGDDCHFLLCSPESFRLSTTLVREAVFPSWRLLTVCVRI